LGTTTRGFRYPDPTDAPNGPAQIKNLADDVQAELDGDLPVGSVTAAAGVVANGLTVPVAGAGVEIGYTGGVGFVQAQQRGPDANKPLAVAGSQVRLTAAGVQVATATSTGVDFPLGFTGKRLDSPYFRAYRSTGVSYTTGATVVFEAETSDPNGWYDTATGAFVPTVAGMYRLTWMVASGTAITADKYWRSKLRKNGGDVVLGQSCFQRGTGMIVTSLGSGLVSANGSTDSFSVVIEHDVGSATAIGNGFAATYFEAERIGA
jgi:hypothetical protein